MGQWKLLSKAVNHVAFVGIIFFSINAKQNRTFPAGKDLQGSSGPTAEASYIRTVT